MTTDCAFMIRPHIAKLIRDNADPGQVIQNLDFEHFHKFMLARSVSTTNYPYNDAYERMMFRHIPISELFEYRGLNNNYSLDLNFYECLAMNDVHVAFNNVLDDFLKLLELLGIIKMCDNNVHYIILLNPK